MNRIFICGIATETHGFNKVPTTLSDFTENGFFYVQENESLERFREGDNYFRGFLEVAEQENWELIPGVSTFAWPAGPVTEDAFETLWGRIEIQLRDQGPFDAIYCPLHGGMACEHILDPEGEFVARVRNIVGPDTLVAVTLDPHANLSPQFVRDSNIVCGFHTTPHTDVYPTSLRAATLMARALRGEIAPQAHSVHPPLLHGIDTGRTTEPTNPVPVLLEKVKQWQQQDSALLDGSFFSSFPHADQPWTGASGIIVVDGDNPNTEGYLDEIGEYIWDTREFSSITICTPDEAVDAIEASQDQPGHFLLVDFSDCPYAGAYGDATGMVKAFVDRKTPGVVTGPVFDAETVEQAHSAGVGATIDIVLGGKQDPGHGGGPLSATATVKALSDGKFMHKGPYQQGQPGDLGKSCLLDIEGVLVIVNPFPSQLHDREQYKLFGVNIEEMNVVCTKGVNHVRADLEPGSRGLLFPDSGGIFSMNFAQFDWQHIRRPIWPLDEVEISSDNMIKS